VHGFGFVRAERFVRSRLVVDQQGVLHVGLLSAWIIFSRS
jgi:hypothetical protein